MAKRPAPKEPASDSSEPDELPPLLPPGNAPRWVRGSLTALLGALMALSIMVVPHSFPWGVPVGFLAVVAVAFGVLDLAGSFDDPKSRVHRSTLWLRTLPSLCVTGVGLMGTWGFISLAVGGALTRWSAGLLITVAFMTTVVGVYRLGERIGVFDPEDGSETRPMLHRHGFWLVTAVTLLYLPMLGSHSLSDPWETHYGEVSREIVSRDDWISLWWAQDGWFWSKPVLDFWTQALSMLTFGVRHEPGQMLAAASEGGTPWPEWGVRFPVFLFALLAIYLLYRAVARSHGRRAGLLGGLVLASMPQFALVTHQTMTDMPFVALMSASFALFLLGIHQDPERELRVYEVDFGSVRIRWSGYHLLFGAVLLVVVPQILYLLSRNIELSLSPLSLVTKVDTFMAGSAGNCGLPGNVACKEFSPVVGGLSPALQALLWCHALGLILYLNWGERRVRRLLFLAAWFLAALSTMAKGPAGLGLPVLCVLIYVVLTKRYRDLLDMEIATGALVFAAVTMPWFVAMYARHGQPFTDRLLFHDMFKRVLTGVHDTNQGVDVSFRYYVWQLGYATFPWVGLLPTSLLWWARRPTQRGPDPQRDTHVLLFVWFIVAFALFSLMLTKFHHYILPALPPMAMLTGIVLDDLIGEPKPLARMEKARSLRALACWFALVGAGVVLCVFGVTRILSDHLVSGLVVLALGGQALALSGWLDRVAHVDSGHDSANELSFRARYESAVLGVSALLGGALVFLVGRDLVALPEGHTGQPRLLYLFTYNYTRRWPSSLDFSSELWAFIAVGAMLLGMTAWPRIRRTMSVAFCAVALAFSAWLIDDYFVQLSPHWGQRQTVLAYQRANAKIPGPVSAYQMNWKGENFYLGNRVAAFVKSGKPFKAWVEAEKERGVRTFYFFTEHARAGALHSELGRPRQFQKLTTEELNNKFLLVRATFD